MTGANLLFAADHSDDVFHHVRDSDVFELPKFLGGELKIPEILGFQITKFMILQVVAGIIVFLIFRGLSKRVGTGEPVRGRWWNFWEMIALFIRDEVVRPTIGDPHHHHDDVDHARHADFVSGGDDIDHLHDRQAEREYAEHGHPADRYLPFIWTCFFYILICNLLGAIPWLGSATGEINVTGALAVTAFGMTLLSGIREMGFKGFLKNLAPGMELPGPIKVFVLPLVWVIEAVGLLIKHAVLAVRLFANMLGGHTVIAVVLGFIAQSANDWFYWVVLPSSVLGQVAVGLLELLVAFLQAYIFSFLATLFIATVVHEH